MRQKRKENDNKGFKTYNLHIECIVNFLKFELRYIVYSCTYHEHNTVSTPAHDVYIMWYVITWLQFVLLHLGPGQQEQAVVPCSRLTVYLALQNWRRFLVTSNLTDLINSIQDINDNRISKLFLLKHQTYPCYFTLHFEFFFIKVRVFIAMLKIFVFLSNINNIIVVSVN